MESLKAATARGIFWSFLDSFGVYLVKFGFSIVIARTLSPQDYGLMGMIVIFISLGQMIMQSGFSMALIQKKDSDATDLSTAFWFNVMTAGAVYLILFFTAGAIASFYQKPVLVSITRVAAAGIVLNSLCSVQVSILTKRMDFKRLTWINLVSALISGTTGLIMALRGYAVWALVFQTLAGNLIYMIGLWLSSSWKPQMRFNLRSFKALFNFGYKILLQGLTDVLFSKIYFPLIGKFYSVSELGFYTNANRFYELFVRQTSNSVTRVIFPAFATIQDEKERFNVNYIRSFNLLAVLMFFGSVMVIISSRPFVALALTDKWLPAVPLMQLFFIEGFFFPQMMFNQNILCSVGKSGLSLKVDIIRKAGILLSILLVFRLGIKALIIGQVTSTAIALIVSMIAVVKIQAIRLQSIIVPLTKLLIIVALCLLADYLIIERLTLTNWQELVLKCILIPALYFLLAGFFRLHALTEIKNFLKQYRSGHLKV
jgi:teichuronic acid exporter